MPFPDAVCALSQSKELQHPDRRAALLAACRGYPPAGMVQNTPVRDPWCVYVCFGRSSIAWAVLRSFVLGPVRRLQDARVRARILLFSMSGVC